MTLGVLLENKSKNNLRDNLLLNDTFNIIKIEMLMKFKVICVSKETAAGDESFQIWQLLLNQNIMKASLKLPGSCQLSHPECEWPIGTRDE